MIRSHYCVADLFLAYFMSAVSGQKPAARRALNKVAIVAVVDGLLLVALLTASISNAESAVSVIGPLHGVGYLYSVYLTVRGAGERHWHWWFPVAVFFTAGPPGALIGHQIISRQLAGEDNSRT